MQCEGSVCVFFLNTAMVLIVGSTWPTEPSAVKGKCVLPYQWSLFIIHHQLLNSIFFLFLMTFFRTFHSLSENQTQHS